MGIKFYCPNGHKLNVKSFLSGKKAICPKCGIKVIVPEVGVEPAGPDDAHGAMTGAADGFEDFTVDEPQAAPQSAALAHAAPIESAAPVATITPTAAPVAAAPIAVVAPTPIVPPAAAPIPADAIAEAPTAVWYVRPPSGGQFGPAAGEIMRQWLVEGRVTGSSLVWRAGWADWRSAASVFPQLGGGFAAPLAGPPLVPPAAPTESFAPIVGMTYGAAPAETFGRPLPIDQLLDVGASDAPAADDGQNRRRKRRRSGDPTMIVGGILGVLAIVLVIVLALVMMN